MSNVTSSGYPVQTTSKAGDQFTIVRNGQLMKLTRAGLDTLINSLAPGTVLELTDTPASYVGQQGKVMVVNSGEDGMAFEAATSGNFLALSDVPGSYGGNAGRIPTVNTGETALEFVSRNDAAPDTNLTGGFADYNHGGGTQAYTSGDGWVKMINDDAGPATNETYLPAGVTTLYDGTNSQFDFSQLPNGSIVTIRVDSLTTTTASNQVIQARISAAIGGTTPFQLTLSQQQIKASGDVPMGDSTFLYVVDDNTRNNPAQLEFKSPKDATLTVTGFAVKVNIRGA